MNYFSYTQNIDPVIKDYNFVIDSDKQIFSCAGYLIISTDQNEKLIYILDEFSTSINLKFDENLQKFNININIINNVFHFIEQSYKKNIINYELVLLILSTS